MRYEGYSLHFMLEAAELRGKNENSPKCNEYTVWVNITPTDSMDIL